MSLVRIGGDSRFVRPLPGQWALRSSQSRPLFAVADGIPQQDAGESSRPTTWEASSASPSSPRSPPRSPSRYPANAAVARCQETAVTTTAPPRRRSRLSSPPVRTTSGTTSGSTPTRSRSTRTARSPARASRTATTLTDVHQRAGDDHGPVHRRRRRRPRERPGHLHRDPDGRRRRVHADQRVAGHGRHRGRRDHGRRTDGRDPAAGRGRSACRVRHRHRERRDRLREPRRVRDRDGRRQDAAQKCVGMPHPVLGDPAADVVPTGQHGQPRCRSSRSCNRWPRPYRASMAGRTRRTPAVPSTSPHGDQAGGDRVDRARLQQRGQLPQLGGDHAAGGHRQPALLHRHPSGRQSRRTPA